MSLRSLAIYVQVERMKQRVFYHRGKITNPQTALANGSYKVKHYLQSVE